MPTRDIAYEILVLIALQELPRIRAAVYLRNSRKSVDPAQLASDDLSEASSSGSTLYIILNKLCTAKHKVPS